MTYGEVEERGYDGPPPGYKPYNCGGWASRTGPCGADDCESCHPGGARDLYEERLREEAEETATTLKVVTARKARFEGTPREIRPGDRVRVTNGFTYVDNGPRTGYFRHYYRIEKGPAWDHQEAACSST